MHIAQIERGDLNGNAAAVDLAQTPGDVVFMSFSDSDLAAVAAACARAGNAPTLRLANLNSLAHPYSVDLHIERVCAQARFVLVRLLGGMDYWRYGVEQLAASARANGFKLAFIPGDRFDDPRLAEASTLPGRDLLRLWNYFEEGGADNLDNCLAFIAHRLDPLAQAPKPAQAAAPFAHYAPACRPQPGDAPRALIVFYRAMMMAGDVAPVAALADALHARGANVEAVALTSLKDVAVRAPLLATLEQGRFDIIVNLTAFAARGDAGGVLDAADAPVLQAVLATCDEAGWAAASRGLGAADLAMHVALPELDGRILSRAIAFKNPRARDAQTQIALREFLPAPDRIDFVADLALAWARLRRKPARERKLACILSDYPAKSGRVGYAIGLDAPASAVAIAQALRAAGYSIGAAPGAAALAAHLSLGEAEPALSLADYRTAFAQMPADFRDAVTALWGPPEDDPALIGENFKFQIWRTGKLIFAAQPDRGGADRKAGYHDLKAAPRHRYVAFYIWLRRVERIDAMIQLGAHGTLEWLPGKAVALSAQCAPEILLGPTPVIYPFIVSNPGEAAQAKRRLSAVTLGHLAPPLVAAGASEGAQELEALFDEYAQAQALDPVRARAIASAILDIASRTGLLGECAAGDDAPEAALAKLDAWLCDIKDMRIGDGLHVYGVAPPGADAEAAQCGPSEIAGLLAALSGRFVAPGPAGALSQGRRDILPTGRNIYSIDPRAVPTRNAYEIGKRAAQALVERYASDHGEWPRRLVLDLWGSATMRTGGDEIAQALALIGARPVWDHASSRVSGFEILPLAMIGRSRVDVSLRLSGLFRDVFPTQIELLSAAIRAVAMLDEPAADNPLIEARDAPRIFGAAPGRYGAGLSRLLASGAWAQRDELGAAYLAASSHSFDAGGEGVAAPEAFRAAVANADAYAHVQDLPGQDVLDADAFAEHEGGFAAAAAMLGRTPTLYHVDATAPGRQAVRPLRQEIARVLRGRATNKRWIAGQMRHGHRGAIEIAEGLDNLFAFAALADAVESRQFDMMFDATLGDDSVREFLQRANPLAARAMADRFAEAARRGFWISRRNSAAQILAAMLEAA